MVEQKLAFSLVVCCSHSAMSLRFFLFFNFFDLIFFLNGFPNPFIALFRSCFLFEPNFHLALVVCSHAAF